MLLTESKSKAMGARQSMMSWNRRRYGWSAVWKEKQLVSRRLLAYDTTNFYTWTASTNQRNRLAQRGHNKQGRHNLRQVGLSYVLDGENGISLCHHVYAGNVTDAEELPKALDTDCEDAGPQPD